MSVVLRAPKEDWVTRTEGQPALAASPAGPLRVLKELMADSVSRPSCRWPLGTGFWPLGMSDRSGMERSSSSDLCRKRPAASTGVVGSAAGLPLAEGTCEGRLAGEVVLLGACSGSACGLL
jgi:hypothetical protein